MGHLVGVGQVMVPETRVEAIRNFIHTKPKKQLQAFLGMKGYYRKFIPRYAEKSSSLTSAIQKKYPTTVEWNESVFKFCVFM